MKYLRIPFQVAPGPTTHLNAADLILLVLINRDAEVVVSTCAPKTVQTLFAVDVVQNRLRHAVIDHTAPSGMIGGELFSYLIVIDKVRHCSRPSLARSYPNVTVRLFLDAEPFFALPLHAFNVGDPNTSQQDLLAVPSVLPYLPNLLIAEEQA